MSNMPIGIYQQGGGGQQNTPQIPDGDWKYTPPGEPPPYRPPYNPNYDEKPKTQPKPIDGPKVNGKGLIRLPDIRLRPKPRPKPQPDPVEPYKPKPNPVPPTNTDPNPTGKPVEEPRLPQPDPPRLPVTPPKSGGGGGGGITARPPVPKPGK
jgi:hypothetical protein